MERHSVTVFVWVFVLFISSMFAQTTLPKTPAEHAGTQTTWQAIASRIPGGLDARRIAHLEEEWQVAEIEPNLLKMTHKQTGIMKYVDITDRGPFNPSANTQVIDLTTIDTSLYNQRFKRWRMFPIGGFSGYPMVIGDFNRNGKLDLAGTYKYEQNLQHVECAVAELQPDSNFTIQKIYHDLFENCIAVTDVDSDELTEFNFRWRQEFHNYEATNPDSFPSVFNLRHKMWDSGGAVGYERFSHLDGDSLIDVLFKGDDSLSPPCQKLYVAEYDPANNRFMEVYDTCPPHWGTSGFSFGDFDEDGRMEFATGQVHGYYYIIEASGDNHYEIILQDTISASNAYLTGETNDIDGNGHIEFFMGGSSYWGGAAASLVYWIEGDGNNNYRKVRKFFLRGTDVLGLTRLFIHDVDADGQDDLVFSFEFVTVILKWNRIDEKFDINYLNFWNNWDQRIQSVNIFDVFDTGKPGLFINIYDTQTTPQVRTYLYRAASPAGLNSRFANPQKEFELHRNIPNPFNNTTLIQFLLSQNRQIKLKILDLTGREVKTLINNQLMTTGKHEITWDGTNNVGKEVSSGVYLYELTDGRFRSVKKLLLIK
ncbi:MAG: T9SS type A sorting domain-containing protein [Calditrichia bacterium]